jgi:hypothetical protein
MPSLIGNKINQVPTNGDLGTLAFQDSNAVNITGGVVDVSAGTAALPTLGTTGDPNTGVFFPAADTVAVATNGAEAMRVDSSGRVGVGISPSARLHSYNAAGGTSARLQTGTTANGNFLDYQNAAGTRQGIVGFIDSTNLYVHNDASASIIFDTNNTERMRIDASGNVGVGVTPSSWGSLNAKVLQIPGGAVAGFAGAASNNQFHFINNAYTPLDVWTYLRSDTAQRFTTVSGQFQWFNAPSGTAGNPITWTQAMTLNASGNLGIGTTSPASRLHAEVSAGDCKVISRGSAAAWFSTCGNNATSGTNSFDVLQDSSNIGYLYNRANAATVFGTNNAERMRIHASGGVSIGNTTDAGAGNLNVTGSGKFGSGVTGLIVQTLVGGGFGAIYNTNVTPSATNYSFIANTNSTYINNAAQSGLLINANPIAIATSTGLAVTGVLSSTGLISPQQAATAPTYVKGAIYFDTTLNKLRVGGATGWETITSV